MKEKTVDEIDVMLESIRSDDTICLVQNLGMGGDNRVDAREYGREKAGVYAMPFALKSKCTMASVTV